MRFSIVLLMICLFMKLHAQSGRSYRGIKWEMGTSWEQIKVRAKLENKYIFVDAYATWCGPCKMMDQNIYSHWRVGDAVNDHFISVKVQMDVTINDDENVKSWYDDARAMMKEYKIGGFPTYLFFSPNGQLVHKEGGAKEIGDFIRLTQMARDPRKPLYYSYYKQYKNGKKYYSILGDLSLFTLNLIGDRECANVMAKDYKKTVLDKLKKEKLLSKEYFEFIQSFPDLINSKDKFFDLCYTEPNKVDSVTFGGTAHSLVASTITREEIDNKIQNVNRNVTSEPNWEMMESQITMKYRKVDAKKLILDYQIIYYLKRKNWIFWAKYKDERIRLYSPTDSRQIDMYAAAELNTNGAWAAFLRCSDTNVLKRALDWIDQAITLKPGNVAYLDTKANLLYKMGQNDAAIALQQKVVRLEKEYAVAHKTTVNTEVIKTLEKMEKGEPTWPQDKR